MAAPHLDELKRLGSQLKDARFVCGGTVDPASPGAHTSGVSLCYTDADNQARLLPFPPSDPRELDNLVSACVPATFGRGGDEVLDPSYRQAVRLEPSQFMTSFNLAAFPILQEVQRLIGSNATGLLAILHKLNVYTKGGFFKAHRDTPRSAQCVGTLVMCLPTTFQGGEFKVKSADGSFSHTFDWGATVANGKVQWCAFYSDCEHEVLPVRQGHRVTLTYVLEHEPLQHPVHMDAQPFSAFGERLAVLLKDPTFAPQGTKLGFGLQHQYIISKSGCSYYTPTASRNAQENAVVTASGTSVPLMKGADRVLKETLDRLGLQYAFVPVYATPRYSAYRSATADERDAFYDYDEYDDDDYGADVPPPTEWQFPFRTQGAPHGAWRGDQVEHLFISDWNTFVRKSTDIFDEGRRDLDVGSLALHTARDVVWVVPPTAFPYLKTSIVYGNEPELGHYYAAACLVVYVPPSTVRSG